MSTRREGGMRLLSLMLGEEWAVGGAGKYGSLWESFRALVMGVAMAGCEGSRMEGPPEALSDHG